MSSKGKVDDIELVLSGFECVGLICRTLGNRQQPRSPSCLSAPNILADAGLAVQLCSQLATDQYSCLPAGDAAWH